MAAAARQSEWEAQPQCPATPAASVVDPAEPLTCPPAPKARRPRPTLSLADMLVVVRNLVAEFAAAVTRQSEWEAQPQCPATPAASVIDQAEPVTCPPAPKTRRPWPTLPLADMLVVARILEAEFAAAVARQSEWEAQPQCPATPAASVVGQAEPITCPPAPKTRRPRPTLPLADMLVIARNLEAVFAAASALRLYPVY